MPTKEGICIIDSKNGDSKVIVEGKGWEMLDYGWYGADSTGYWVNFARKVNEKSEIVSVLTSSTIGRVVKFDPIPGEIRGFLFKNISLDKTATVVCTDNGIYEAEHPLFWGTR
jgi:hypothetical protein